MLKKRVFYVLNCMQGKAKGKIISAILAVAMLFTICSVYSTEAFADAGVAQPTINATPNGLDFSEQTDQSIKITNTNSSVEESYLKTDKLYPYATIDMNVYEQNKSNDNAEAMISFLKDNDNKIVVSQKSNTKSISTFSKLDFDTNVLTDPVHPRINLTASPLSFTQTGNVLNIANTGTGRQESYIKVGDLASDASIDVEVSSQIKTTYTANAGIDIRSADGKNRIVIVQRPGSTGTFTVEPFVNTVSKGVTTITSTGVDAPYTIRVKLSNGILSFYRVKAGVVSTFGTLDVKPYFDLTNSTVLSTFSVYCGARLDPNEKVSITKAEQYQETGDTSCYVDIFKDGTKVYSKSITPLGENPSYTIRVKENGNFLTFSRVKDNNETLLSTVYIKDYFDFLDSNVLKDFSLYQGARLGAGESVRVSKLTNTPESSDATPDQITFSKLVDGTLHSYDSNIELQELNGSEPIMGSTSPGGITVTHNGSTVEFANNQADASEAYVKLGPLFAYAGQDMDVETQTTSTTSAAIMMFYKDDGNKIVISQQDFNSTIKNYTYTVYKNGAVVNTTTVSSAAATEPYTMRVRTNGRYIVLWRMVNGALSYFSPRLQISDWFDLRDPAVLNSFTVYVGAKLAPGENVKISGARQYLTDGVGQADPRFFHYENGESMIENDVTWLTLSSRCDTIASTHTGVYSYNLKTNEIKLLGIITFDKGDGLKRPLHSCDVLYDRNDGKWKISATSFDEDHRPYGGIGTIDPRVGDANHITDISVKPVLPDGEDASIIWDKAANKWRAAWVASVSGGFALSLAEADSYSGPYTVIKSNTAVSETGSLIQKMGGKYYIFTGRGTSGEMWVYNYPDCSLIGRLNVPEGPVANNIWPVILPYQNTYNGTSYRMMTFDRYMGWGGDHSYGKIYIYEGNKTNSSWDYPVLATGVMLNEPTKTLYTGDTFTLVATVSPGNAANKTVIFESSSSAVSVSNSVYNEQDGTTSTILTANNVGTATITATTSEGGYTSKCEVTVGVKDSAIDPSSTNFDKYSQSTDFKDIEVTVALNGNTLTAIKNGTAELVKDTDYTVNGNVYTFKKAYFKKLAGTSATLTFEFSAGKSAALTINMKDSTPTGGGTGGSSSSPVTQPVTQPVTGSTLVEVKPVLSGSDKTAQASVSATDIKKAFDVAKTDSEGIKTVTLNVAKVDGADKYAIEIPKDVLSSATTDNIIKIDTPFGEIAAPSNMFKSEELSGNSVQLTIGLADKSAMNEAIKQNNGGRPFIELKVSTAGNTVHWSNTEAPVKISIDYKPTQEELKKSEHITVWYIDRTGKAVAVPSARYNVTTGKVTFTNNQFGKYAVVYVDKTFSDIAEYSWAKDAIEVMASKGVINGTSDTTFTPAQGIKRADFIMFLVKSLGLSVKSDTNFDDIKEGSYYYDAVAIAKKLGITNGVGDNKFNPTEQISRQDMMVLVTKAMRIAKKLSTTGSTFDISGYSDVTQVSGYAMEAVSTLIKERIIEGIGNNMINPKGTVTRAETAMIIYKLYNK